MATVVCPLEITLSTGIHFSGEFVSQNDNFVVIRTNGTNVSIGKKMIAEISGLPEGVTVALPGALSSQQQGATSSDTPRTQTTPPGNVDQFTVLPGMELDITMQNGSLFQGTVITEDDRLINLQTEGGARVNIYKHVIRKIKNRTTGSIMTGLPMPRAAAPASRRAPVTVAQPAEQKLPDPVQQAAPVPGPVTEKPVEPTPTVTDASKADRQPAVPTAPRTPSDGPAPVPPLPVQATPLPVPVPPVAPATIGPPVTSVAPAEPSPVAPKPHVPAAPKKRSDGKSELVLKTGTTFIGTIVSENNRVLLFSTGN
ncbi:MAG: hypothetical protein JXA71_04645, partial [Chitinispirillaceae bacterium]|nr:hypothetical protein [Chitinispirillaceae bacterium]